VRAENGVLKWGAGKTCLECRSHFFPTLRRRQARQRLGWANRSLMAAPPLSRLQELRAALSQPDRTIPHFARPDTTPLGLLASSTLVAAKPFAPLTPAFHQAEPWQTRFADVSARTVENLLRDAEGENAVVSKAPVSDGNARAYVHSVTTSAILGRAPAAVAVLQAAATPAAARGAGAGAADDRGRVVAPPLPFTPARRELQLQQHHLPQTAPPSAQLQQQQQQHQQQQIGSLQQQLASAVDTLSVAVRMNAELQGQVERLLFAQQEETRERERERAATAAAAHPAAAGPAHAAPPPPPSRLPVPVRRLATPAAASSSSAAPFVAPTPLQPLHRTLQDAQLARAGAAAAASAAAAAPPGASPRGRSRSRSKASPKAGASGAAAGRAAFGSSSPTGRLRGASAGDAIPSGGGGPAASDGAADVAAATTTSSSSTSSPRGVTAVTATRMAARAAAAAAASSSSYADADEDASRSFASSSSTYRAYAAHRDDGGGSYGGLDGTTTAEGRDEDDDGNDGGRWRERARGHNDRVRAPSSFTSSATNPRAGDAVPAAASADPSGEGTWRALLARSHGLNAEVEDEGASAAPARAGAAGVARAVPELDRFGILTSPRAAYPGAASRGGQYQPSSSSSMFAAPAHPSSSASSLVPMGRLAADRISAAVRADVSARFAADFGIAPDEVAPTPDPASAPAPFRPAAQPRAAAPRASPPFSSSSSSFLSSSSSPVPPPPSSLPSTRGFFPNLSPLAAEVSPHLLLLNDASHVQPGGWGTGAGAAGGGSPPMVPRRDELLRVGLHAAHELDAGRGKGDSGAGGWGQVREWGDPHISSGPHAAVTLPTSGPFSLSAPAPAPASSSASASVLSSPMFLQLMQGTGRGDLSSSSSGGPRADTNSYTIPISARAANPASSSRAHGRASSASTKAAPAAAAVPTGRTMVWERHSEKPSREAQREARALAALAASAARALEPSSTSASAQAGVGRGKAKKSAAAAAHPPAVAALPMDEGGGESEGEGHGGAHAHARQPDAHHAFHQNRHHNNHNPAASQTGSRFDPAGMLSALAALDRQEEEEARAQRHAAAAADLAPARHNPAAGIAAKGGRGGGGAAAAAQPRLQTPASAAAETAKALAAARARFEESLNDGERMLTGGGKRGAPAASSSSSSSSSSSAAAAARPQSHRKVSFGGVSLESFEVADHLDALLAGFADGGDEEEEDGGKERRRQEQERGRVGPLRPDVVRFRSA
jgi:hypothetical protein